jgi:hypothetical protein
MNCVLKHRTDYKHAIKKSKVVRGKKRGKAILVTGPGGSQGRETSRLQHFRENRLTDGGEVVYLMRQLPFTPRKIAGIHFC